MFSAARWRIVVADDDEFLVGVLASVLRSKGFEVREATTAMEAWELTVATRPHAVVSDLDFGGGMTGADLLRRVHEAYPGTGLVMLTSHQDPQLVLGIDAEMPRSTHYVVKGAMRDGDQLLTALLAAVEVEPPVRPGRPRTTGARPAVVLTADQAEALRLLAQGASTRSIAASRGTSVRATELLLARLYGAMGLDTGKDTNPAVAAVRLWHQGAVRIG